MAITIDTLKILAGLDHEQLNTSKVYSIDSARGSAVSAQEISIPDNDKQANVVFNNDYDLDGSSVFVRVALAKVTGKSATENTSAEVEVLPWTEIPGGASEGHIIETGAIDLDGAFNATLHIYVCLNSTTAHTGTEVIVQTSAETGVNGSWTDLRRYTCCVGTAVEAALTATADAAATVLEIANPVASGFDRDGKKIFVENATPANSEIVIQTEHGADA